MKKIVLLFFTIVSLIGCVEDANNCLGCNDPRRRYKIELRGQSSSENTTGVSITYYGEVNGTLKPEIVTSQIATDFTETHDITTENRIGFKLSVANGVQAPVNTVIITDDNDINQIFFENHELNIPGGKTFMYSFFSGNYSIID